MTLAVTTRPSDSPFVECVWQGRSASAGSFISLAATSWELVVTYREDRSPLVTVRGPGTFPVRLEYAPGGDWFGIRFRLGSAMPALAMPTLVDRAIVLPGAGDHAVHLNGARWPIPDDASVETFVGNLHRAGLLVADPLVDGILHDGDIETPTRTVQRHFQQVTGLSRRTVRQIQRAMAALEMLQGGLSIADTVYEGGYYDQAHLTRALRRWTGQTPAHVRSLRVT